MPVTVKLDKWVQPSALTRGYGIGFTRRARSTRMAEVTGLTNNTVAADQAIAAVEAALIAESGGTAPHLYHHGDTDLPVASITAIRSTEFGPEAAGVIIDHRRVFDEVDLKRSARSQVRRIGSISSFRWWRDTTSFDSNGRPDGPITFRPYRAEDAESVRIPRPWSWSFGVTELRMSTILDSNPSFLFDTVVNKINSGADAQWFEAGAAPAKSLLYLPYQVVPLESGQYFATWRALYNTHKWITMDEPILDSDAWTTQLEDAFLTTAAPTFTVHTP